MKKPTRAQHPPEAELPPGNRALVPPIYQSVKFEFEDVARTERTLNAGEPGYFYSRRSNPTLRQLELMLAEMQGREDALVTGSGVAAIGMCLLSLLKQGDHVVCFAESYAPTRQLVKKVFGRFGVTHTMLSIEDATGLERVLSEKATRLVIFESPTNPITKVADIPRLTALARKHGALTVLDNTFAGFHNHGQYDIDVFLHSLTKFASGHGDVLGGVVIANADVIRRMHGDFTVFGASLDPHAAYLILRGMKTYFVRYREQCANAMAVAKFLETHSQVESVRYPGLASHPQHALAKAQMQDFGSVLTFEIRGGLDAARRFTDALEFFSLAGSLGSTESLVMPPQLMQPRDLSAEHAALSGITQNTIRLSIGLEQVEDLIEDLRQALEKSK